MSDPSKSANRRVRVIVSSTILVAALVAGVYIINHVSTQTPLQTVLDDDPRNAGISARAHYKHYISPSVLVFDLGEVDPSKSPFDVFRVFLQYADAMKAKQFDRVELAFRGEAKFILDGAVFHEIGQDFGEQNPMYTVRTFPEHLRTPDGERAFDQWEGGALGVLSAQMDDFNEFHRRWYIDDL